MASKKTEGGGLLGALEDPEGVRLVGELLDGVGRISRRMGGAQPVIDALARSFALMSNAAERSEYDQIRLELIRYLRSLDANGSPTGGEPVELERSPDVSAEELEAFAGLPSATGKAPKG